MFHGGKICYLKFVCEGLPHQGIGEAGQVRFIFAIFSNRPDPPRVRPFGGRGAYRSGSMGVLTPSPYLKSSIFRENPFSLYSLFPCGSSERDPLSPPEGEATQGEQPLDPLIFGGFPMKITTG